MDRVATLAGALVLVLRTCTPLSTQLLSEVFLQHALQHMAAGRDALLPVAAELMRGCSPAELLPFAVSLAPVVKRMGGADDTDAHCALVEALEAVVSGEDSADRDELIAELLRCIPRAFYYKRGHFELKSICGFAAEKGFTHLLVLTERLKAPNGLLVVKLPLGPTAAFKLRSTVRAADIRGHGAATSHVPELILNNFSTRLGRRVGRVLGSLFPHTPDFAGRQVVTFHNQRDFVFFRHHRYVFEDAEGGTGTAADEG